MTKKAKTDKPAKIVAEWDDISGEVGNDEIPDLAAEYRECHIAATAAEAHKKEIQPHLAAAMLISGVDTIKTDKHQVTYVRQSRKALNMEKLAVKLATKGLTLDFIADCYDEFTNEYPLVSERDDNHV